MFVYIAGERKKKKRGWGNKETPKEDAFSSVEWGGSYYSFIWQRKKDTHSDLLSCDPTQLN